jgi:hypothetical protein
MNQLYFLVQVDCGYGDIITKSIPEFLEEWNQLNDTMYDSIEAFNKSEEDYFITH